MQRRSIKFLTALFTILLVLPAVSPPATAELKIVIRGSGPFKPMPIAVTVPVTSTKAEREMALKIAEVVRNDLRSTGLFSLIDPQAFIQRDDSVAVRPRYNDWKALGAEALISGRLSLKANGDIRIEFRLWDVNGERQQLGRAIEGRPAIWRRLAHKVADAIYTDITGESGYFDTRVVYVAESGPVTRRVKRLAIMDQDGANHRFLSSGGNLVLTPRFSPSNQEITYLAYVNEKPRVYIYNLDSGRREIVGDFPGMTFAPRFSPDGNRIVMSLETGGNSEIYSMDLRTRVVRRLTNHQAIDTSPSYSPDGKRIVFNSDRSGRPKLYVMDAAGGNVTRISNKPGSYSTPVWSPRGDWIAFTKQEGGRFSIGVMQPDGSGERILASGFLAEGPTWSPNGRVIMFLKQARGGSPQLYSIDLTGRNERRIQTPGAASDPAWSPLLKD